MHGLISPFAGSVLNRGRIRAYAISTNGGPIVTLSLRRDKNGFRLISPAGGMRRAAQGTLPAMDLAWGDGVMVKLVELPPMPEREIADTLRHTEQDSAPFSLRDAWVGALVVERGSDASPMKVLMAAMERSEAKKRLDMLRSARLRPVGISVAATAIGALFRHSRTLPKTGGALFVHIEEDLTGVHIFKDAMPVFTREIPVGTGQIVNAISAGADGLLSKDEIRAALTEYGVPRNGSWRRGGMMLNGYHDLARAPMERLATEVSRSVDYLRRSDSRLEIKNALLVGSGALIGNMDDLLSESCGMTFKRYDPFEDFVSHDGDERSDGPRLAIHIGQALDGGATLNLCEPGILKRSFTRLNGRPFRLAAVAVALMIALAHGAVRNTDATVESNITKTASEVEALRSRAASHGRLSQKLAEAEKEKAALLDELRSLPPTRANNVDWRALLNDIALAIPADIALTRITFDDSRADANGGHGTEIRLEGLARGAKENRLENIAELAARLNGSAYFESAALKRMSQAGPGGHAGGLSFFEITANAAG